MSCLAIMPTFFRSELAGSGIVNVMKATPSKQEIKEMLKWLNRNDQQLRRYGHEYIAYNANGIIAHGENLRQVLQLAEDREDIFSIYSLVRSRFHWIYCHSTH